MHMAGDGWEPVRRGPDVHLSKRVSIALADAVDAVPPRRSFGHDTNGERRRRKGRGQARVRVRDRVKEAGIRAEDARRGMNA